MKLIRDSARKWIDKEGYSKKIILAQEDIGFNGARVQVIKIKPGRIAKNHYHKKQIEIFYFLNKNGFFIVNGEKIEFQPGDTLVVEPNNRHEVVNKSESVKNFVETP